MNSHLFSQLFQYINILALSFIWVAVSQAKESATNTVVNVTSATQYKNCLDSLEGERGNPKSSKGPANDIFLRTERHFVGRLLQLSRTTDEASQRNIAKEVGKLRDHLSDLAIGAVNEGQPGVILQPRPETAFFDLVAGPRKQGDGFTPLARSITFIRHALSAEPVWSPDVRHPYFVGPLTLLSSDTKVKAFFEEDRLHLSGTDLRSDVVRPELLEAIWAGLVTGNDSLLNTAVARTQVRVDDPSAIYAIATTTDRVDIPPLILKSFIHTAPGGVLTKIPVDQATGEHRSATTLKESLLGELKPFARTALEELRKVSDIWQKEGSLSDDDVTALRKAALQIYAPLTNLQATVFWNRLPNAARRLRQLVDGSAPDSQGRKQIFDSRSSALIFTHDSRDKAFTIQGFHQDLSYKTAAKHDESSLTSFSGSVLWGVENGLADIFSLDWWDSHHARVLTESKNADTHSPEFLNALNDLILKEMRPRIQLLEMLGVLVNERLETLTRALEKITTDPTSTETQIREQTIIVRDVLEEFRRPQLLFNRWFRHFMRNPG